jgi:hypothetical protein
MLQVVQLMVTDLMVECGMTLTIIVALVRLHVVLAKGLDKSIEQMERAIPPAPIFILIIHLQKTNLYDSKICMGNMSQMFGPITHKNFSL